MKIFFANLSTERWLLEEFLGAKLTLKFNQAIGSLFDDNFLEPIAAVQ